MAEENTMGLGEFVSWIAKTRKIEIDVSCGCARKRFLTLLRDDPDKEILSIHSNLSNWKIRAMDETGKEISDFDENEDIKISQDVVSSLKRTFETEIGSMED